MAMKDKIYLKISRFDENKIGASYLLSTERDHVRSWGEGGNNMPPRAQQVAEIIAPNKFRALSHDFYDAMEIYVRSVPFVMSGLPFLVSVNVESSIRGYVKKNGIIVEENDKFDTYELNIEHGEKLKKKSDRISAIREGIDTLPKLFLIGIVTAYDTFMSSLIRIVMLSKPEILSSSEKNISFSDLVSLGSIEMARERIIDKEIDIIMRSSHSDQIEWLEKKLGIDLRTNDTWPKFAEICERRNLLTHTDGRVSQQYMQVCKKHKSDVNNIKVGDVLTVSFKYYNSSVRSTLEYGLKVLQIVWRKINPEDLGVASKELNRIGYDLIEKRNYKLAASMYEFALKTMKKHGNEAQRLMMVINYANAHRMDDNMKKALEIINGEDWSASAPEYKICVAAIKNDIESVLNIMPLSKDSVSPKSFREWPVFNTMRENPKFISAFESLYGEKLFVDSKSDEVPMKIETETVDDESAASKDEELAEKNTMH